MAGRAAVIASIMVMIGGLASAQTPPSPAVEAAYRGLHAAAANGDAAMLGRLIADGAKLESRDSNRRTPLHVAAFKSHETIVAMLAKAGADMNALDGDAYDVVTIAAVANDTQMLRLALSLRGNPKNITSPYDGTALIAAAHLGHVDVVLQLIGAGAPLDHVNNLGWTALIEAVILGDGGPRHTAIVAALIDAGADASIADRQGVTPLAHARAKGYDAIIQVLESGAK
jgi:ankyrin repeat protein